MFNSSSRNNLNEESRNIENERLQQNNIFNDNISKINNNFMIEKNINMPLNNTQLTRDKRCERNYNTNRNDIFSFAHDKYKRDMEIKNNFLNNIPEDTRREKRIMNTNNNRQTRTIGTPFNKMN